MPSISQRPEVARAVLEVRRFPSGAERALVLADLEDLADVGMIKGGCGHRLAPQPFPRVGVRDEVGGENLDRDLTIKARVARAIHDAHAPLAERFEDFVGAEARTDG